MPTILSNFQRIGGAEHCDRSTDDTLSLDPLNHEFVDLQWTLKP
ncbi:hypothetical protein ACN4EK_20895 [Pantanalinema rosaneae CENA516]